MKIEIDSQMGGVPIIPKAPAEKVNACSDLFQLEKVVESFGSVVADDFGHDDYEEILALIQKANRSQTTKILEYCEEQLKTFPVVFGVQSKALYLISEKKGVFERRPKSFDV